MFHFIRKQRELKDSYNRPNTAFMYMSPLIFGQYPIREEFKHHRCRNKKHFNPTKAKKAGYKNYTQFIEADEKKSDFPLFQKFFLGLQYASIKGPQLNVDKVLDQLEEKKFVIPFNTSWSLQYIRAFEYGPHSVLMLVWGGAEQCDCDKSEVNKPGYRGYEYGCRDYVFVEEQIHFGDLLIHQILAHHFFQNGIYRLPPEDLMRLAKSFEPPPLSSLTVFYPNMIMTNTITPDTDCGDFGISLNNGRVTITLKESKPSEEWPEEIHFKQGSSFLKVEMHPEWYSGRTLGCIVGQIARIEF
jgi:hypothetical protein